MIKNILFDMDGTLIDCKSDRFLPYYRDAIISHFMGNPHVKTILGVILNAPTVMVANDGSKSNREAFIEYAAPLLDGIMTTEEIERQMLDFYEKEYLAVKPSITPKPDMIKAAEVLKKKDCRLIVTTNPLFPLSALIHRLEWGGHKAETFDFVTSYETSHFAKPNPLYYEEVLKRFNLNPAETLIVGNDMKEDIEAGLALGLQTFFMEDTPILNSEVKPHFKGSSEDFLNFVMNKA